MRFDRSLLEAALVGLTVQRQKLDNDIQELRQKLSGQTSVKAGLTAVGGASGSGSRPRRHMSAAARKRIAEAQKKRWATFHARQSKPAAVPKKKLSAERRAALAANLAKARAARAAKRAAA